jgi:DNA repair exonuclease SbcCD ATPase subunit
MASDDSSSSDGSEYESDSSAEEPEAFAYPAKTTPFSKTSRKVISTDEDSSSYDTDSDSDADNAAKKSAAMYKPMKKMPSFADSVISSSGESFGGDIFEDSDDEGDNTNVDPDEEEKRKRLGDVGYAALQEKKADIRLQGKINTVTKAREKHEREERSKNREMDRHQKDYEKDREMLKQQNEDLEKHSTHLIKHSRELIRKSSSDMEELKLLQQSLEKDNDELDCASEHWKKDADDFEKMRKQLESTKVREVDEEDVNNAKKMQELAYRSKQEARRMRSEKARERRANEDEQEAAKARDDQRKKDEKAKEVHGSDKARTERAYGWYTKLAFPNKEEMIEKVAGIANVDISIDDVDLLPWTASGKRVNVAKVNMILFAR